MNEGVLFAIVAAITFGMWTVFHQKASAQIDSLVGAIIVSLTAVVAGVIILLPRIKSTVFYANPRGILFAVLAGLCALTIDIFALKAYGSGLQVSVGGPIIIAGSVAVASLIGFFLGDSISVMKIIGLILVIAGSAILSIFSK